MSESVVTVLGKYTVYSFDNPYLDNEDGENRYSAAVIMDEARERWRTGNWRAKRESFHLSRKEIAGKKTGSGSKPSSARFRLDIRKDLMGETISLKKLSELSYSASYRPQGNLDEHLVTPMSTMQRYDVLAGDLESPPEDLSFLTDADSRLRRELEKSGNKKDGTLRKDTRRLEKSLDERRAALIDMLPDADTAEARQIVRESQRRKQRMDAEIGRLPKDPDQEKKEKKKTRRKIYAVPSARSEEPLPELRDLSVLRSSRMPKQYGLDAERAELPEFESETRHWSRITSDNPSWSEIQQHTENLSPSDLEDEPETRRAHYVDDVEYDPERPFRPVFGVAPRERLYSEEVGQYENEYNKKNGISPDRIREIMDKEYRGRWIPPEYYADDRLVNAWFNDLNRGVLEGEDFLDWAYRRRMEAARARQEAEEHRRRSEEVARARSSRRARPSRADRREDARQRYERAMEMGYRQGRELADRDRSSRGEYHGMYPDLFGADERHDNRYDDRYDDRYDSRYDDRYDDRYDRRYDGRYDDRYDDRYDSRYDDRYDDRYYDDRCERDSDRRRFRRHND